MSETNRIEYKRELTSELDIEKEVVAFLNYKEGGYIYIGIDKDGSTVGVNDVDDCMLRLKDRIKHNISPSAMGLFDIAEEQKDGRSIIKVTVASGIEKPYFKTKYGMTPRGAYLRVGTSAEPMPQEQIDRLFAMRTRNSIGRIVSNRQDLSFEQLRIYYDERGKRLNVTLSVHWSCLQMMANTTMLPICWLMRMAILLKWRSIQALTVAIWLRTTSMDTAL